LKTADTVLGREDRVKLAEQKRLGFRIQVLEIFKIVSTDPGPMACRILEIQKTALILESAQGCPQRIQQGRVDVYGIVIIIESQGGITERKRTSAVKIRKKGMAGEK